MTLPFSPDAFFAVFAQYNQSVWPIQVLLNALALLCLAMLFRANEMTSRITSLLLALLWAWMGLVYHLVFFSRINPAAWVFGAVFLVGSAVFLWFGVVKYRLRFRALRGVHGALSWVLIVFALAIYPVIGYSLGHRYPAAPTFGLPCPTTIFTIGLLLFAEFPVPRVVFAVPVLWAAVGSLAAVCLDVYEDLALVVAGVIGLSAAFSRHQPVDRGLHASRS
jgi:hypothetical protein